MISPVDTLEDLAAFPLKVAEASLQTYYITLHGDCTEYK